MNSILLWAKYYISKGWYVIPLYSIKEGRCTCGKADCASKGKHPATPNGTKDASLDPNQIDQWFSDDRYNIGICTGEVSGLTVLDVDPDHGGDESLKQYQLKETAEVSTGGGGQHYYFKHPGGDIRNSAGTLGKGLDVRGHHGYVVAPPSNHISGGTYHWKVDPHDVELAGCPDWIYKNKNLPHKKIPIAFDNSLVEGQRNNTLTSIAGTIRRRGLGYKAILAALEVTNVEKCKPPLPQAELEKIANSVSNYPLADEEPWDLPAPLGHFDLPVFPLEAFPSQLCVFCVFCAAVAESFQVPVDLPAMLILSVSGAALAKRVVVHVRGDHWEPVNLFTVVALPPGNRKSGVFRVMTEPLSHFEKQETQRLEPEIKQNHNQRMILEKSLKYAQDQAAKAKKPEDAKRHKERARELTEELLGKEVLKSPQYIGDDATPESVALLLNDNDGRFALLSPEGDIFDLMAGRYSSGNPNLGVYLKGHAGDDIRVNRANREFSARYVHKPALSIGMAVQPEVLRGLTLKKGFRGRGLLGRFLYSLPQSLLGFRKIDPIPIDPSIASAYEQKILETLRIIPKVDLDNKSLPHTITVSGEALSELDRFMVEIEKRLGPGGDLAGIGDWAGKLAGAVCRIAGIFHGLIHAASGNPSEAPINAETMLGAIAIGEYLIPHAKAAFFEMGTDPAIDTARRILDWVFSERITEFTKREVFNSLRGGIQKVDELDEPLLILVNHGYIREATQDQKGPGRKPSPKYKINPLWLAQNTQNTHNCQADVNSAYSAQFAQEVMV